MPVPEPDLAKEGLLVIPSSDPGPLAIPAVEVGAGLGATNDAFLVLAASGIPGASSVLTVWLGPGVANDPFLILAPTPSPKGPVALLTIPGFDRSVALLLTLLLKAADNADTLPVVIP